MAIQEGVGAASADLSLYLNAFKSLQSERDVRQYGLNKGKTAWRCDLCSDAECEHKLFSDLVKSDDALK
jgi:hypothetical protein